MQQRLLEEANNKRNAAIQQLRVTFQSTPGTLAGVLLLLLLLRWLCLCFSLRCLIRFVSLLACGVLLPCKQSSTMRRLACLAGRRFRGINKRTNPTIEPCSRDRPTDRRHLVD